MSSRIYYAKPSITELEVEYASDAARNGWGDRCYEYIERFESLFKGHIGSGYAIAASSCTGALHMGLSALGVGPGDEVILADINWIASAAPAVHLGAKPVFVDILPGTWCIDPVKLEAAITKKTKAIIAVHLYGNLCEMDEIILIGKKYGIPVVEDAAEAIGSVYKGRKAGSMGDFGVFSFHGTKTLTTGEGGMFVTDKADLYEKVLSLSNHGRVRGQSAQFWPDMTGFKYKMSNVQAAIGCGQVERVEELVKRKREIFFYYHDYFKQYEYIRMNPVPDDPGTCSGYWMPAVVFDRPAGFDREKLLSLFKKNNIDARVFFYPMSMLPMFKKAKNNTVSYNIYPRAVNLPSYHDIDAGSMQRVMDLVSCFYGGEE